MLFGQSIFQSVLDRLEAEEENGEAETSPAGHRIRGLNTSFVSPVREGISAAYARPDQAYVDNLGAELPPMPEETLSVHEPAAITDPEIASPQEPEPPRMPPHLLRIRPQEVAEELAISSRDTQQSLSDKRRLFAKNNHPDGVDGLFRENATIRMKIANLLIDEAMRRLAIMARLSK